MKDTIIEHLIQQEKQLLAKTESVAKLAALIDEEFLEIGSSSKCSDKAEVIRWLSIPDQSQRSGTSFKAQMISEDVILLTYISSIQDTPNSPIKQAMRSSIWRLNDDQWRMVFHQGTPLK